MHTTEQKKIHAPHRRNDGLGADHRGSRNFQCACCSWQMTICVLVSRRTSDIP